MPGIDEDLIFRPLNIAVLTISDTRTREDDRSGDTLAARVESAGHVLAARGIVKDDVDAISTSIRAWSIDPDMHAIITTGGTGLTGRDVTVEAVTPLFDKVIDGFPVLFHQLSFKSVGLSTLQSRACAGLIDETFVFCLPGSTGAVKDGWDHIISGLLDSRYRPCSLVDLLPRLSE
ncbi:molybdenum cofactor biosynthesis protein B [Litorimonas sp. WD9-15]|uniref:molybdenum cofactor biosynthesis protein B n=1 Tax=Litorimonas sp. WD9-15 TaxID=3418716 RepID=UPI003D03BD54